MEGGEGKLLELMSLEKLDRLGAGDKREQGLGEKGSSTR